MDADRGAILLPTLPSAPDLPPETAGVLGEVPARLGVPFVSPIFNALAAFPGYLVPVWKHSRQLIGSPAFGEAAARLTVPAELLSGRDDALKVAGVGVDVDVDAVRRYTRPSTVWYPSCCSWRPASTRGGDALPGARAHSPVAPGATAVGPADIGWRGFEHRGGVAAQAPGTATY